MQNRIASNLIQRKPTKKGNGVFIAGPAVILPGVTIGDQVLIRCFSTVTRNVPSRSIVDSSGIQENVFAEEQIKRLVQRQLGRGLEAKKRI